MKKNIKNNSGFNLIEMVVVMAILSVITAGITITMISGQDAWTTTEAQIRVQENLRIILEKISSELRESGSDSTGTMQVNILNGAGINGSDVIRFSIPIVCDPAVSIINDSGDVVSWGATLNWGCRDSSCMDADADCSSLEYKYIEYTIDSSNRLVRRIRDGSLTLVKEEIFANNITDLQAVLSADNNIVTLTIGMNVTSNKGRELSNTTSLNVYLRNRG